MIRLRDFQRRYRLHGGRNTHAVRLVNGSEDSLLTACDYLLGGTNDRKGNWDPVTCSACLRVLRRIASLNGEEWGMAWFEDGIDGDGSDQDVEDAACVFCEIIAGRAAATFVRRWPDAVAIVPLKPVVDGHVIVIPNKHVADFSTDPKVSGLAMERFSELAAEAEADSCNLISSRGVDATQSVFHLHLHLVPRAANDGLALPWYSGRRRRSGTPT